MTRFSQPLMRMKKKNRLNGIVGAVYPAGSEWRMSACWGCDWAAGFSSSSQRALPTPQSFRAFLIPLLCKVAPVADPWMPSAPASQSCPENALGHIESCSSIKGVGVNSWAKLGRRNLNQFLSYRTFPSLMWGCAVWRSQVGRQRAVFSQ